MTGNLFPAITDQRMPIDTVLLVLGVEGDLVNLDDLHVRFASKQPSATISVNLGDFDLVADVEVVFGEFIHCYKYIGTVISVQLLL